MMELLKTSDPVELSFVQARLAGAGVECVVLDGNVGALFGQAIPARLMVDEDDWHRALRILRDDPDRPVDADP